MSQASFTSSADVALRLASKVGAHNVGEICRGRRGRVGDVYGMCKGRCRGRCKKWGGVHLAMEKVHFQKSTFQLFLEHDDKFKKVLTRY